ncbi:hypothetical protein GGR54DRAFT_142698 [Hypoxylon sp. NC1633]|nr:hypothetical protein GGR54DRAFT_142698 [Hypoxylon sp. NC1633]
MSRQVNKMSSAKLAAGSSGVAPRAVTSPALSTPTKGLATPNRRKGRKIAADPVTPQRYGNVVVGSPEDHPLLATVIRARTRARASPTATRSEEPAFGYTSPQDHSPSVEVIALSQSSPNISSPAARHLATPNNSPAGSTRTVIHRRVESPEMWAAMANLEIPQPFEMQMYVTDDEDQHHEFRMRQDDNDGGESVVLEHRYVNAYGALDVIPEETWWRQPRPSVWDNYSDREMLWICAALIVTFGILVFSFVRLVLSM